MAEATDIVNPVSKTKRNIIIGLIVLVILIILFIFFYFKGRKAGKEKGSVNITTPPVDNTGAVLASEGEINMLVGKLYKDMDGGNFFGHNMEPWETLLALSDTDFVRTNNAFNNEYQVDTEQSFKEWVQDESNSGYSWPSVQNTVLSKMEKPNIK